MHERPSASPVAPPPWPRFVALRRARVMVNLTFLDEIVEFVDVIEVSTATPY